MKAGRIVILFVALALIVVLEVALVARCSRQDVPEPTATPEAAETLTPEVTVPVQPTTSSVTPAAVTQTPEPTEVPATPSPTPVPTQAPTPTPAPTAEPTPTPLAETDTLTAAGSFSSDTGTSLNLGISWSAVDHGDGTTTISIYGTVTSYSLQLGATSISISFEGYSASATGNSLSVDGGSMVTNGLFSTSMTVPSGTAGMMTVSWGYNGSYNDTALGTITATDFVYTN